MKKLAISLLAAASLASLPSFAQDWWKGSWYAGVGIGRANLGMTGQDLSGLDNAQVHDNDTSYTARMGYRFNPYFALELGYYDLGHYNFDGQGPLGNTVSGSAKAKSFGLSAVAIAPLGDAFDIYGRVGYARSELKLTASSPIVPRNADVKDKQDEATYGVGGRWHFAPQWGLFAEWMKNDKIQVDSYLAGIDFRF